MIKNILEFQKKKTNSFSNFLKIIIILIIINFGILALNKKLGVKMKVCICAIGKMENKYIKEYVEYYKKLGVDKIYLYDNNEINGESFENVILDYLNTNYVKIINYRGYQKPQIKMQNICYKKNYLRYDWIMFYDLDEYLYLKNYSNIKRYLNEFKFNKCQLIYLNFIFFTDNNNLYYENKTLERRFTEKYLGVKTYFGKSIIRGNISCINITNVHYLTKNIQPCNGFGKISKKFSIDYKYYYIKHFSFKSTEEYCVKINKGNAVFDNNIKKKK